MSNANIVQIDNVHQRIHDGKYFDYQELNEDVANNGFVRLSIRPQTTNAHLVVEIDAEGKCYFKSYVNTTWSADGTAGNVFNRYIGTDTPTADTVIYTGGTVDTLGALRFQKLLPGGSGFFSTGISANIRVESVIEAGQEITLEIQNVSGGSDDIGITLEWYEEG